MKIDEEFQKLLPPLTDDEYDALETSILQEGIREPLIVWDGVIIDGHNRYSVAQEYGIDFDTQERTFESREAAKVWMIDNQKGRRNLTDGWKWELAQTKRKLLKEKGKQKKEANLKQNSSTDLSINDNSEIHNTQKEVAKDLGWSTGKVAQAEQVWDKGDDEVKERVKNGELTIGGAYKEVKSKEKKKVHVSNNSGENEWYTPPKYLESARNVMGGIDTDPASSRLANKHVKADVFYTKEDNGLEKKWLGSVWMNPPYGQPEISNFIDVFYEKWQSQEFSQGIVLVNNATETKWFQKLLSVSVCICFVKGRIRYLDSEGVKSKAPLQGQAILYFGDNDDDFAYEFSNHGICLWTGV